MEKSSIYRIRAFLKRRAFAIGALAVTVPLLVIIFLQYHTLTTLNMTLPAYRRQLMRQYLMSVVEDFSNLYKDNAERALDVPIGAIGAPKSGVIKDDYACETSLKVVAPMAAHFKKQNFKGAKRYFIAVSTEHEGVEASEVFFYDPTTQAMIRDYEAPEIVAIKVACASYMVYIRKGSELLPQQAQSVDSDPRARLLVKPILNEWRKVVAVAGMTLDYGYFLDTVLPEAIRKRSAEFLPLDNQDSITSLYFQSNFHVAYDGKGRLLELSEGERNVEAEAYQPILTVFSKSSLSVRSKNLTAEQLARRNFMINVSLWIVMTLSLIVAVTLMLRTASREMKLTQMKADFVSNVSHELRTPLASIRVMAELLNMGRIKEPDRVREYGAYIESEGRRLTNVINNILDFSRIESGGKLFQFESCDLKELVNETLDAFAVHLKQNGFTLSYDAPQNELPKVVLDPDAIALALTNLLDNAIKYSGDVKEIKVSVTQSVRFVAVSVSDRGIGIAADEQEKIFEKFYRIGVGLVHDVKGSGLGLSLVKHIVIGHQGRITVQSKPGEGSTFTIQLPFADQTSEQQIDRVGSENGLKSVDDAGYKFTG
jgi:signal transduction histidine kinase